MDYVNLGKTGLKVSRLCLGCMTYGTPERGDHAWTLPEAESRPLIQQALELGINFLDTANVYSEGTSEEIVGRALRDFAKRDDIVLATKVHFPVIGGAIAKGTGGANRKGLSRKAIMTELEDSLRRLGTDYVDVYLNHAVNDVDRLENPEWGEFVERARTQGKIRASGMSGHAGHLVNCLDYAIDHDLADVILVAYNFGQDPAFYEQFARTFDYVAKHPDLPRVLDKAKQHDVGVVTMKTLMGARLNDMRPYETGGATFAQAAFRWVLSNPNVDALVVSMTGQAQIDEYLAASGAGRAVSQRDVELLRHYARLNGTSYCRHACNDCEGACPYGVPIADVLRTRMYATDYQDAEFARREYQALEADASACLSCSGAPCRDACSHGLPIADLCGPTHQLLS